MAQFLTRENFLKVIANELGCEDQIAVAQKVGDFEVDKLLLSSDLNADSLDTVALGMQLEEAFGIELTDADLDTLDTDCPLGDVYKLVERIHSHQFTPANA